MHHSVFVMNIHFTGDTAPSDIWVLPQSWSQAASQWSSYESVALIVKGSECWQHAKNFKRQQLKFFFHVASAYESIFTRLSPSNTDQSVLEFCFLKVCPGQAATWQHERSNSKEVCSHFFPLTSFSLLYHPACSSSFSPPLSGGGINTMVGVDCRSEQAKVWTLCRLVDKEADNRTDPESQRRRRMARNVNFDLSHHLMEAGLE